jgi:histone acetyltransferase 1
VDLQEGSTRNRRTPLAEVRKQLSRALPDIIDDKNDNDSSVVVVQDDYLKEPFGTILEEYTTTRTTSNNGQQQEFCITMADGKDEKICHYHNSVQRLARFFIETADDVDVSNSNDGGYWRVLYLFCRHDDGNGVSSKTKYSLAGYTTLFHFMAPFRKPLPGTIVRICQAIVLPPYQRAGHGRQMLRTIHRWVHGEYAKTPFDDSAALVAAADSRNNGNTRHANDIDHSDTVEINVESPAPAFVTLRNRVDFEEFLRASERGEPWIKSSDGGIDDEAAVAAEVNVDDEAFFQPLTETCAKAAATRAKITPRQIHLVYELDRLYYLFKLTKHRDAKQQSKDNTGTRESEERIENLEKRYRLMVKRRLKREHREDLSTCKGKTEMQAHLAKLYDDQRSMYDIILASVLRK